MKSTLKPTKTVRKQIVQTAAAIRAAGFAVKRHNKPNRMMADKKTILIAWSTRDEKCYFAIPTSDGRARVDYFGDLADLQIWDAQSIGHEGRVQLLKQRPDLRPDYT